MSAYSPDVLGCVATGQSVEEVLDEFAQALQFHLEALMEGGDPIPEPRSLSYHLNQTDEISSEDIIAHVDVAIPEAVAA